MLPTVAAGPASASCKCQVAVVLLPLGGSASAQYLGQFGDVFAAAHGEVGLAAAFAADGGAQTLDDFSGLVAGLNRGRRAEGDEAGFFAEGGAELHDAFADFGEHLRSEAA